MNAHRSATKTAELNREFLDSYAELGYISQAAQAVGQERRYFYHQRTKNELFKKEWDKIAERLDQNRQADRKDRADQLEDRLFKVASGEVNCTRSQLTALIFALKNLRPAIFADSKPGDADAETKQVVLVTQPPKPADS